MEAAEISAQAGEIRKKIEKLLEQAELSPCFKANLEAAREHIELLCIELGLDIQ